MGDGWGDGWGVDWVGGDGWMGQVMDLPFDIFNKLDFVIEKMLGAGSVFGHFRPFLTHSYTKTIHFQPFT